MKRIDSINARPNVNGTNKAGFSDNADLSGQDATYLTPDWLNMIQEELCNLLEKNGITLNKNDNLQLYNLLTTDADILALSDEIEKRLTALAALSATKTALQQAIDYMSSGLQQHKDAKNPHPQYLLATTFGVDLPMTASTDTSIDDNHNVFGWNGSSGTTVFQTGTISWHNSSSGTIQFKPFRSYGQFLFNASITTADEYRFTFKIFDSSSVLTQTIDSAIYYSGGYKTAQEKFIFTLQKGGYVEIDWFIRAGGVKKTDFMSAIYVDDRPVAFSPVGYTSVAKSTNDSGTSTDIINDGYNIYPNYTWFYYSSSLANYVQLNDLSTLSSPVDNVPHFNRTKLANIFNTELWVIIEVAKQTVELPSSDYATVSVQVVRASTDEDGDVVVEIPFAMRNIDTPNNETLVYSVSYYDKEVKADSKEDGLNGKHTLYARVQK